jgi:hypothetical protein
MDLKTSDLVNMVDAADVNNLADIVHVLSSGFLFYSHPPNSNNIYFLLGKDDYNNKWSDFGGRRDTNELEIDCAVREMMEETLCTVRFDENNHHHTVPRTYDEYFNSVKQILLRKDFTYRIGIDVKLNQEYTSIVDTKNKFNRQTLSVSSVSNFSNYIPCNHQHRVRRLRVCYVKYIPWQPDLPLSYSKTYAYLYHLKNRSTLSEKIGYYKTLPTYIQTHPAIIVDRTPGLHITNITVLNEWLEKQEIRWFSLTRLKNALKNGGKYKKDIIRYGFLSTLSVVIEKMSKTLTHYQTKNKSSLSVDCKFLPYLENRTQMLPNICAPTYFQIKF